MNTPRNNPLINPDDPKWTAYILDELDEAERAEVELLLETSDEARALVEELSIAATSMKEELTSLLPLMMTPEQRTAIREAAKPAPKRWLEMFPSNWGLGLAAAAVLLLAIALPVVFFNTGSDDVFDTAASRPSPEPAPSQEVQGTSEPATAATGTTSGGASSPNIQMDIRGERTAVRANEAAGNVVAPVLTPAQVTELVQSGPPAQAAGVGARSLASSFGSTVSGTVVDRSGALIPAATVKATAVDTGVVSTTTTNEAGAYNFASLLPGSYTLTASLPGFQTKNLTDIRLNPSNTYRYNFDLAVQGVNTQVEVNVSAGMILATQGASVGQVLDQQKAQNLPLVGNNVLDLITVKSGVENVAFDRTFPGVPADSISLVRDGIQTQDTRNQAGIQSATTINPDLVQELRIVQAPFAAEQGRSNASLPKAGAPPPPPPPPAPGRAAGALVAPPAVAPAPVARPADRVPTPVPNTEAYDRVTDNPFIRAAQENLATFSIDVDTASYANVRRFLNQNQLPPRDAVRIEELVNYFSYDYAQPTGNAPIAPNMEVAPAPWNPSSRLVRIGIKAREVNANRRPPSNLVFLIDVSGSMNSPERLPLVKAGLNMLVNGLGENDMVSIVVYAGNSGLVLAPTSGMRKEAIRQAIDSLQPGGSTNGASGIQLAYNQATANFLRGGVNRVILMTDGDFNVGITNQGDLTRLIEERAKSGVFLSVLGFGMGNYKDSTLEKLADQGNGNYAYIDTINEARKVLVEEMSSTLVTVAKDVKIQVDFNPARVEAYRLIGYENRVLRAQDFNNDAKDAGDMGAGHTVTALFEVVPKGGAIPGPSIDPSKYTQPQAAAAARADAAASNELLTLRVRYKLPDADTSTRMDVPLVDRGGAFARATTDFRFAAAVAQFGMVLRDSPYKGTSRMDSVLDIAEGSLGVDRTGYRKEFITLVQKARNLGR